MSSKLKFATANLKTYYQTAKKLGFKTKLYQGTLLKLIKNKKTSFLHCERVPINNCVSVILSQNKYFSYQLLAKKEVPFITTFLCKSLKDANKAIEKINYPVSVKPILGAKGKGVALNLKSQQEIKTAVIAVRQAYPQNNFLLCQYIKGRDYRILILNNKIISTVKRLPPYVIGNNKQTILKLIEKENRKRLLRNQKLNINTFKPIELIKETEAILAKKKMTLYSVPQKDEQIFLRRNANRSTGGVTQTLDWPNFFHPQILATALKSVKILKLKLAAVDLIIKDPQKPLGGKNGKIIELNSLPGINMHHYPDLGDPQPVAGRILKYIFTQI